MQALGRVAATAVAPLCIRRPALGNRALLHISSTLPLFPSRRFRYLSGKDTPSSPPAENNAGDHPEQVDVLKKEVAIKETQLKELKESYLLALADMENLRQRTKKEVEAASHFAIQRFCKDIISVADVLEMALSSTNGSGHTHGGKVDNPSSPQKQLEDMLAGLELTLEELHKVFARHGVTPIAPLHQRFDPNLHNALYEIPTAESEPGTIVAVQKKGYLLNQRVIRPADVGVARKP